MSMTGVLLLLHMACAPFPSRAAVFDPDGDGAAWGDDCDNTSAGVAPGLAELPYDGLDNDCDPTTPDDDLDADGFDFAEDCDDSTSGISPIAADLAQDGVDQNCDQVDGTDADGDGVASDASGGGDCDDGDPSIHAGAMEICDTRDNDCDGRTDDEDDDLDLGTASLWFADSDNDGYGDAGASQSACITSSGMVADANDCADNDASRYPGAPEVCLDWVVNDCNGTPTTAADQCGIIGETISLDSTFPFAYFGAEDSNELGAKVSAGDIGANGVPDIILYARSGAEHNAGALIIVSDSAGEGARTSILYGDDRGDNFGESVTVIGGDLFVGAPQHIRGLVYRLSGATVWAGADHFVDDNDVVLANDGSADGLGCSIIQGDFTGNSASDLVVGSCSNYSGGTEIRYGALNLFDGDSVATGALTLSESASVTAIQFQDSAAIPLANLGDATGDGRDDIIVGDRNARYQGVTVGAIHLIIDTAAWTGSTSLTYAEHFSLFGTSVYDQIGVSVAGPGDVNGDGYTDVLTASSSVSAGSRICVIYGPSAFSTWDLSNPLFGCGGEAIVFTSDHGQYMPSVAGAGDVDADGTPDIVVGSPANDADGTDAGGAFVILMGELSPGTYVLGELDESPHAKLRGQLSYSYVGTDVSGAGDVDLDGRADVLVGAQYYSSGGSGYGAAFLVLGGGY